MRNNLAPAGVSDWRFIVISMPSFWELMLVFAIVILIFGTGKLANVGKDLGSAIKEFKKGVKDEEKPAQGAASTEGEHAP